MKYITRFLYTSNGVNYRGTRPGMLSRDQIRIQLLAEKRGCSNVWNISYKQVDG